MLGNPSGDLERECAHSAHVCTRFTLRVAFYLTNLFLIDKINYNF